MDGFAWLKLCCVISDRSDGKNCPGATFWLICGLGKPFYSFISASSMIGSISVCVSRQMAKISARSSSGLEEANRESLKSL